MANTAGQSYGGFWVRVLAYLVDTVVFSTIMVGVGAGAALLGDSAPMVYIELVDHQPVGAPVAG